MGEKRAQKNLKRQKRKQKKLREKQPTNSHVQQQPDEPTYMVSISVSSDTVDALDIPIAKRLQEELGESEVAREFTAKPEADSKDADVT